MIRSRLSSVIERRLLVNYRVDPHVAAALLPAPLRPQLVRGQAVAGICLLRIGGVRPVWAPAATGLTSENAAHRIAVEWEGPDGVEQGVYIPRRDTASRLNAFAGGRIYPGEHGRADFTVREDPDAVRVAFAARDGEVEVDATVEPAEDLRGSGLFADLAEASEFFRRGSRGLSPQSGRHAPGRPRTVHGRLEGDGGPPAPRPLLVLRGPGPLPAGQRGAGQRAGDAGRGGRLVAGGAVPGGVPGPGRGGVAR